MKWEDSQVFAGRVPFSNENRVAGVCLVLKGRRSARPDHPRLPDRACKVIKGCWKGNPAQRMTIAEVVTIPDAEVSARKSYQNVPFPPLSILWFYLCIRRCVLSQA